MVANRVTDVCVESLIHGITSEIGSEQDVSGALVNIKWSDFNKRGRFLELRFGLSSLSSPLEVH